MWEIDEDNLDYFFEHDEENLSLMWLRGVVYEANRIELTPEKLAEHLEKIKETKNNKIIKKMKNILDCGDEDDNGKGLRYLNNLKGDLFIWVE